MFSRCALVAIGVHAAVASLPAPSHEHVLLQKPMSKPSKVLLPTAASLVESGAAGNRTQKELLQGGSLASVVAGGPEAHTASFFEGAMHQIRATIGQVPEPDQAPEPKTQVDVVVEGFKLWVVWMVLALIVVHTCYTRNFVPDEPSGDHAKHTLESGHFGCFADSRICVCSMLCPGIRWADTLSQASFMTFWAAFALWALLSLLNTAFTGVAVGGLFTFVAILYFRQQLRQKLNLPAWRCPTLCVDICFILFCSCCAIAQEARVVRQAFQRKEEGFETMPGASVEPTQEQLPV